MAFFPLDASALPAADRIEAADNLAVEPVISINGQQLEIEIADDLDHQLTVYALTGQIVKTEQVGNGKTTFDLPKGYYIVKVDKTVKKVIVR